MADNVKISYYARENTKVGVHSIYPQPVFKGTFGFERMCKKAANNTTIEEHTVRAAVMEYMKVAKEALLEGNRVEIGEQFVTLWPNLKGSVKDELNDDGTVKKAVTVSDLKASKCKSRVSATVNAVFSAEFERRVSWQKTDKTGAPVADEEDATETNDENEQTTGTGTSTGDNGNTGGTGDNGGSGENGDMN